MSATDKEDEEAVCLSPTEEKDYQDVGAFFQLVPLTANHALGQMSHALFAMPPPSVTATFASASDSSYSGDIPESKLANELEAAKRRADEATNQEIAALLTKFRGSLEPTPVDFDASKTPQDGDDEAWYTYLGNVMWSSKKEPVAGAAIVSKFTPRQFEEIRMALEKNGKPMNSIEEFAHIPREELESFKKEMNQSKQEFDAIVKGTPLQQQRVKDAQAEIAKSVAYADKLQAANVLAANMQAKVNALAEQSALFSFAKGMAQGSNLGLKAALGKQALRNAMNVDTYSGPAKAYRDALLDDPYFKTFEEKSTAQALYQKAGVRDIDILCASYENMARRIAECANALPDIEAKQERTPQYEQVLKAFSDFAAQRHVGIEKINEILKTKEPFVGLFQNILSNVESMTSPDTWKINYNVIRGAFKAVTSKTFKTAVKAYGDPAAFVTENISEWYDSLSPVMDSEETMLATMSQVVGGVVGFKAMLSWFEVIEKYGALTAKSTLIIIAAVIQYFIRSIDKKWQKKLIDQFGKEDGTEMVADVKDYYWMYRMPALAFVPMVTIYMACVGSSLFTVNVMDYVGVAMIQAGNLALSWTTDRRIKRLQQRATEIKTFAETTKATGHVVYAEKSADPAFDRDVPFTVPYLGSTSAKGSIDDYCKRLNIVVLDRCPLTHSGLLKPHLVSKAAPARERDFVVFVHDQLLTEGHNLYHPGIVELAAASPSRESRPLLVFHVYNQDDAAEFEGMETDANPNIIHFRFLFTGDYCIPFYALIMALSQENKEAWDLCLSTDKDTERTCMHFYDQLIKREREAREIAEDIGVIPSASYTPE